MKSTNSYIAITILFLAITTTSDAQDKPTGTAKAMATPSAKKDGLRPEKKAKHNKSLADTSYNPYQPGPPVTKPLPYNSYKEKPAPVKEGIGAAILREGLNSKKKN